MNDDAIIALGTMAERLSTGGDLESLFAFAADEISKDILSTQPNAGHQRSELYFTFQGMERFRLRLKAYIAAKDRILQERDSAANPQEDQEDLD